MRKLFGLDLKKLLGFKDLRVGDVGDVQIGFVEIGGNLYWVKAFIVNGDNEGVY